MKSRWFFRGVVSVFLLLQTGLTAGPGKGHLMIYGGEQKYDYTLLKFLDLAGGKNAKIVIIPSASSDPLNEALYLRHHLETLGATNVKYILVNNEPADTATILAVMDKVDGVFFTGGDQSLLTGKLLNTRLLEKVRAVYAGGGVVGGTSAGAAVMSELMITGNELRNPDTTAPFNSIRINNIEVKQGFGFVTKAIIDQHFIKRRREHRLLTLLLQHPQLLGVGIDERTAIIVRPDDTFQVLGENTVMILDARQAVKISTDKNDNLSGQNLRLHILKSGDCFDLNTGTVCK